MGNHDRDTGTVHALPAFQFNFTKLAPKLTQIDSLVDENRLTKQGQLMHLAARTILAYVLEQIAPALQNKVASDETKRRAKGALIYAYSQLGHKRMRLKRQGISDPPNGSNGQNAPELGFEEVYEAAYRALEKLEMLILDPSYLTITNDTINDNQPGHITHEIVGGSRSDFMDLLAEARLENEILPGKFK